MGFWKAFDIGVGVSDTLNNVFGILEDSVTVRVVGGPGATKRRLTHLAASVAFGISHPLIPLFFGAVPPPGSIGIEYDAAGNEIIFTVKFSRSLKSVGLGGFAGGPGLDGIRSQAVFAGPPETFSGNGFIFRPPVPGGVAPPALEFDGRTVLTTAATCVNPDPALPRGAAAVVSTPNPRPTGDARSRGTLAWLVFQSLASPAETSTHTYPLPNNPDLFAGK